MTIGPKKIALLHLASKQLGFDDETYHAVLFRYGRAALTASDLDQEGFEGVMAYFTACGFRSDWTKRTFGNRPGMASPRQIDAIRAMWREWSGSADDAALNKWIERSFHVTALRFLTSETAGKAINGLRAMCRRSKPDDTGSA